jgi:hypothetical protein
LDIAKNPLPPEIRIAVINYVDNCPADHVLTNILLIDEEVDKIQEELKPYLMHLQTQRQQLLDRAKGEGIKEDPEAMLVEKEGRKMRNKISDNEAFAITFPNEYAEIRKTQKADVERESRLKIGKFEDSATLIDIDIPLTLADKLVGKEKVTEFVGFQPTAITYEVRRR